MIKKKRVIYSRKLNLVNGTIKKLLKKNMPLYTQSVFAWKRVRILMLKKYIINENNLKCKILKKRYNILNSLKLSLIKQLLLFYAEKEPILFKRLGIEIIVSSPFFPTKENPTKDYVNYMKLTESEAFPTVQQFQGKDASVTQSRIKEIEKLELNLASAISQKDMTGYIKFISEIKYLMKEPKLNSPCCWIKEEGRIEAQIWEYLDEYEKTVYQTALCEGYGSCDLEEFENCYGYPDYWRDYSFEFNDLFTLPAKEPISKELIAFLKSKKQKKNILKKELKK